MRIISREEFPEENKEQEKKPQQESLTPWQLANMEYLKQKALEKGEAEPQSQPTSEQTDTDETPSASEPANEEVEEPQKKDSEPPETESEEAVKAEEENTSGPKNGSFLDRLPNIRHERNRRLMRRSSILIVLFSIPALLLLYYISPLGKLGGVTVVGNERISTELIKKELDFAVGENLWSQYFNRTDNIKKLKKQELQIESAQIQIDGFNHFEVTIKEYPEVAYLESGGKYSPVISNGKVIPTEVEKSDGDLPILESFTSSKRILRVLKEYGKLSEEVKQGISQIKYAPTDENKELLEIFMNDGNKVMVRISDLGSKMKYYPQIAKEMSDKNVKGVVDMEAGIYSYPYDENSSENQTADSSTDNTTESSETPVAND